MTDMFRIISPKKQYYIYITCANAKKIKIALQSQIDDTNNYYNYYEKSLKNIKQIEQIIDKDEQLLTMQDDLKKYIKKLKKIKNNIQSQDIILNPGQIEIIFYLANINKAYRGYITKLSPSNNSFDVIYTEDKDKDKEQNKKIIREHLSIAELCINDNYNYEHNYTDTYCHYLN
jgi:hypothetical protein